MEPITWRSNRSTAVAGDASITCRVMIVVESGMFSSVVSDRMTVTTTLSRSAGEPAS